MSDILIKNLELPENCMKCNFPHICKPYQKVKTGNKVLLCCQQRLPDCPLIDIGEHGDLIDRDYLLAMIDLLLSTAKSMGQNNKGLEIFKEEIENAPVILPSNRVGTEENT